MLLIQLVVCACLPVMHGEGLEWLRRYLAAECSNLIEVKKRCGKLTFAVAETKRQKNRISEFSAGPTAE